MQFSFYIDKETKKELAFVVAYFNDALYKQISGLKVDVAGDKQLNVEETAIFERFLKIFRRQGGAVIIPHFGGDDTSDKYIYGTRDIRDVARGFEYKKLINLRGPEVLELIKDNYFIQENLKQILDIIKLLNSKNKEKTEKIIIKSMDLLIAKAQEFSINKKTKLQEVDKYLALATPSEKLKFLRGFNGNIFVGAQSNNYDWFYYRNCRGINKKISTLNRKLKSYDMPDLFKHKKIEKNVANIKELMGVDEQLGSVASTGFVVVSEDGFDGDGEQINLHEATIYPNLKEAISNNGYKDDYVVFEVDMKMKKIALEKGKVNGVGGKIISDYESSIIDESINLIENINLKPRKSLKL